MIMIIGLCIMCTSLVPVFFIEQVPELIPLILIVGGMALAFYGIIQDDYVLG